MPLRQLSRFAGAVTAHALERLEVVRRTPRSARRVAADKLRAGRTRIARALDRLTSLVPRPHAPKPLPQSRYLTDTAASVFQRDAK